MSVMSGESYQDVEKEFSRLLRDEKNRWIEMYRLLDKVEKLQLWKQAGERSFTAWVKDMAVKNSIHESIIWQKKKAGAVYTAYAERATSRGNQVPDPSTITVASESLELINKIAKNDVVVIDDLIGKSLQGTMTRDDLRQAWQSAKANNPSTARTKKTKESGESDESEESEQSDSSIATSTQESSTARVNAKDVITALIASKGKWIVPASPEQLERRKIGEASLKSKILTEFAVRTGSSRKARRIDAVVLENISTGSVYDILIHGIEIKISESDLKNDQKFTEYRDFVDCLWLAVPPELVQTAKEIKPHGCGILVVSDEVNVAESAKIESGIARVDTLQTALVKLF